MIVTIIVAILIFGVLITAHEFGHFITARKSGITVEEFAIGMGPLICKKEKGGTLYTIRALPLGGFCKMLGEDEAMDNVKGAFTSVHPFKRIIVLSAGAIMNFIVAIIIFFGMFCISGNQATTTIEFVAPESVAYSAGIEVGDTITQINGVEITEWEQLTTLVKRGDGSEVEIVVEKGDGEFATYTLIPEYDEEQDGYIMGVSAKMTLNIFTALADSVKMVWTYIVATVKVFAGLFNGSYGLDQFTGPIGVTAVLNDYIPMGAVYVMNMAAAISVSLGFFNLLPIPALDGSRIVFTVIEWIKGSAISRKAEGMVHMIGFAVLMVFGLYIAFQDVVKFIL